LALGCGGCRGSLPWPPPRARGGTGGSCSAPRERQRAPPPRRREADAAGGARPRRGLVLQGAPVFQTSGVGRAAGRAAWGAPPLRPLLHSAVTVSGRLALGPRDHGACVHLSLSPSELVGLCGCLCVRLRVPSGPSPARDAGGASAARCGACQGSISYECLRFRRRRRCCRCFPAAAAAAAASAAAAAAASAAAASLPLLPCCRCFPAAASLLLPCCSPAAPPLLPCCFPAASLLLL